MDALIEPLAQSPRLPNLVGELNELLQKEHEKRQRFYDEMSEEKKMEFINGQVVIHSPAKLKELDATGRLLTLITAYVTLHHLGKVLSEKALICLTRNDYEPDIVFFRSDVARSFDLDQMKFPAPDFVVEVLSPSTEQYDRTVKFEEYAAHGVREYWIVDADTGMVEQFVLQPAGAYRLETRKGDGEMHSVAVGGFVIPVRAIFDDDQHLLTLRRIVA